ncbi:MAG: transporter [Sulfurovum sp.]|nr:transporter [Sulfurovum sp.]
MNQFNAVVTEIRSEGNLNIVKFDFAGISLSMISLELGDNISMGSELVLAIKPSHITFAVDRGAGFDTMLSCINLVPAFITEVRNGLLLSSILLSIGDFVFEAIITLEASQKMKLRAGDRVVVMLKASELSIVEVLA